MLYLLPKRGVGNPVTLTNSNYSLSKNGGSTFPYATWSTGGGILGLNVFGAAGSFTYSFTGGLYTQGVNAPVNGNTGVVTENIDPMTGGLGVQVATASAWTASDNVYFIESYWPDTTTGNISWNFTVSQMYQNTFTSTSTRTINGNTYVLRSHVVSPTNYLERGFDTYSLRYWSWLVPSNNNRTLSKTIVGTFYFPIYATVPISTGKVYWEYVIGTFTQTGSNTLGVGLQASTTLLRDTWPGNTPGGWAWYDLGGLWNNGTTTATLGAYVGGDTIMVAYDAATRRCWMGKNGTWFNSGDPAANTNPTFTVAGDSSTSIVPSIGMIANGTASVTLNDSTFNYTVPSGFTPYGSVNAEQQSPFGHITITQVGRKASTNAVGATSMTSTITQTPQSTFNNAVPCVVSGTAESGITTYISWGRIPLATIKDWIAADLVENTDYASPPFPQLVTNTPITGTIDLTTLFVANGTNNPEIPVAASEWLFINPTTMYDVRYSTRVKYAVPDRYWVGSVAEAPTLDTGRISGVVKENDVPVVGAIVNLYHRDSGLLLESQQTTTSGTFNFTLLDPTSSKYYVVALDPEDGTVYNAKIFDRLTPVT